MRKWRLLTMALISAIAANNMVNFIGSANSNYAPMGCYPHINNCNIALDVIDNIKPGRFGTDETHTGNRKGWDHFPPGMGLLSYIKSTGRCPTFTHAKVWGQRYLLLPQIKIGRRFQTDHLWYQVCLWKPASLRWPWPSYEVGRRSFTGPSFIWTGHRRQVGKTIRMLIRRCYIKAMCPQILTPLYWSLPTWSMAKAAPAHSRQIIGPCSTPQCQKLDAQNPEVIWAAQFDINISLDGRFGGNRSCNYHIGDYTNQTGVTRVMAYGRPFGTFKPSDFAYDNFRDKVYDSRYYKTFLMSTSAICLRVPVHLLRGTPGRLPGGMQQTSREPAVTSGAQKNRAG